MVFSSPIFLFLFLPAVIALYYLLGKKSRNLVLLVFSLLFYAWGEPIFLSILLVTIVANYFFGRAVGALLDAKQGNRSLWLTMVLMVVFNVGMLGFFKYANFVMDGVNALLIRFGHLPVDYTRVKLPIGVSFFIFHSMSYVIDVYRRVSPVNRNLFDVALYLSLFPQLVAGPIVRYHDIASQLLTRVTSVTKFASGIRRFAIGLGKKVLIANTCGAAVDQIFSIPASQLSPGVTWLGAVCYAFQIYYDFSGYSDMAIGLGRMFGFEFLENFNYPYVSRSIREFWRRWHISLSSWFRDYLYIPLGGSRGSAGRTHFNLILVFFLCGLWHGASWTFVAWGLYHGFFLVIERMSFGRVLDAMWSPIRRIYTLGVVLAGWVLFRADDFAYAWSYLKAMAGLSTDSTREYSVAMYLNGVLALALLVAAIGSGPVLPWVMSRIRRILDANRRVPASATELIVAGISICGVVFLIFVSAMRLATSTYNPFIYYRF